MSFSRHQDIQYPFHPLHGTNNVTVHSAGLTCSHLCRSWQRFSFSAAGIHPLALEHQPSSHCLQPLSKRSLIPNSLQLNTKDIKRWCVRNYITLTLQKSTFQLYPSQLQFEMGKISCPLTTCRFSFPSGKTPCGRKQKEYLKPNICHSLLTWSKLFSSTYNSDLAI